MQRCAGPQPRRQWPQLAVSWFRSTQLPLQQAGLPPGAVVQTLPHTPQLALSLFTFSRAPQAWSWRQEIPQLPQNLCSPVLRLKQAAMPVFAKTQVDGRSVGQSQAGLSPTHSPFTGQETHCPAQHLSKGEQTLPHPPQSFWFVRVSTHCPPQRVLPVGQEQVGYGLSVLWQTWPPVHSALLQQASAGKQPALMPPGAQQARPPVQGPKHCPGIPGRSTQQSWGPQCGMHSSACRFPLASNSKARPKAIVAAKAATALSPSLMEGRFSRSSAVP